MNHFYYTFGLNFKTIVNFLRELPKASSYAIRK
jgi:hypothetical protein